LRTITHSSRGATRIEGRFDRTMSIERQFSFYSVILLSAATVSCTLNSSHIAHAEAPSDTASGHYETDRWQMRRLLRPTESERAREEKGAVFIYEGMKDAEVERALDEQFDRVGSMMFVGTIVTDRKGNPRKDPDTGEVLIEEDGCN
jgi:hypothetical protein